MSSADKTQDIPDELDEKDELDGEDTLDDVQEEKETVSFDRMDVPMQDAVAAAAEKPLKSHYSKRCIHCGKRSRMRVVKNADPVSSFSWPVRMLLKTFSPGGIELNKRYQCPRCGRNFNDMTVWEAVIAPIMLVTFMLALLLGFFWFVFFVVPAR